MLKSRYVVVKPVGFVDLGANYKEQGAEARFAYVELDTNKDGIIDEAEADAVRKNLWTIAINGGATMLTNKGIVVSIGSCVDFTGVTAPRDDIAIVLQEGDVITMDTNLSFAQLHWLSNSGYIE
jgi:hypothetical protein